MMRYRSFLFVPGHRSDMFDKACTSGADLVCIDLEDAVGEDFKDEARAATLDWLARTSHVHVSLRINGLDTVHSIADIEALLGLEKALPFVMVPKVHDVSSIETLAKALPEKLGPFMPIVESAQGALHCASIFAHPRVRLAVFGAFDFMADMDCSGEWESLLYARSQLCLAARAHDVHLFDVPHVDVKDHAGCETVARRVKALGFPAKAAIHPAQIAVIHNVFNPTEAEILEAERIIAALDAAQGNVCVLDGKLVEPPMVKKAQRVLALKDMM